MGQSSIQIDREPWEINREGKGRGRLVSEVTGNPGGLWLPLVDRRKQPPPVQGRTVGEVEQLSLPTPAWRLLVVRPSWEPEGLESSDAPTEVGLGGSELQMDPTSGPKQ